MSYEYLELLHYTAKNGGLFGNLKSSTIKIAKELGVSQQTISRKLREMHSLGLIKRDASPEGLTISLDEGGREFLKQNFIFLKNTFSGKTNELEGTVEAGDGEGRFYVSLLQYQKQFKEKLNFNPYPGTLNLRVDKEEALHFLSTLQKININGFATKERAFGALSCYKIKVNSIEAAIVVPERTRHSLDIIEIIAAVHLRDKLKLKDDDKIKINS